MRGMVQYFTDLVGETLENTSRILYGHKFNGKKIEYFIDVSLDGLNVIKNKPHNFLVPGLAPLSLEGRIINHGISSFK
jgi:HYD1 signature containing ADP-ribosyltransferase